MISSIGAVGTVSSSYKIYSSQQALTAQTKSQLESMGINTTNIKSEEQGQTTLQSLQTNNTTQTQNVQQAAPPSGGDSSAESVKEAAISLAQKVGASVSSDDNIEDILDAISQAISNLQAQAANDPQKITKIKQFEADYQSLCQSVSEMEASKTASAIQGISSQAQTGLDGLASYNMASISIANSKK